MRIDKRVYLYALAIMIVLAYGTFGTYELGKSSNFNVKVDSLNEALYFTVVTISTVGYGDITPVTELGRIFVIVLIISGLSIFLSAVTMLSGEFLSSRIEKIYTGLSTLDKKRLKKHIVLIGYDATNQVVAQKLKEQKRNFIIVTGDKPTVDTLKAKGYPAYLADYTIKAEMEKFELSRATDIVVDLKDSSETVYVVLVIKKLAKDVKTSVVAYSGESQEHLADLDIDNVINPITIAAGMLTDVLDRDQDIVSRKKPKSRNL
jgi:voltage-gated potassium channel